MALFSLKDKKELPAWSPLDVSATSFYCWKFEEKEIYLKRSEGNWFFSEFESTEISQPSISNKQIEEATQLSWSTFVGRDKSTIQAFPSFPNRPLVLKPSSPLKILPQNDLLLFVSVPCKVAFCSGMISQENLVYESATKSLSSTWFGEPDNGILSFSLPIKTSSALTKPTVQSNFSILCPIKVINSSNTALDVQRLLLRSEFLNVYWNESELCANEVRIKFKGESVLSDIEYASETPPYIKKGKLLTPAQVSKSSNVLSKSFHFIKSLASS